MHFHITKEKVCYCLLLFNISNEVVFIILKHYTFFITLIRNKVQISYILI